MALIDLNSLVDQLGRRLGETLSPPDPHAIPDAWRDYLSSDAPTRLRAVQAEFAPLRSRLPLTVDAIDRVVRDAFLASSPKFGAMRALVVEEAGEYYPTISFAPKPEIAQKPEWRAFVENAPREFVDLYIQTFDGLTSAYQFGGPMALGWMTRWTDENFDYPAYPWGPDLWRDQRPENFLQIFNSGGGGALYLDLGLPQAKTTTPVVTLFFADHDEPLERNMDFWAFLDQWTSIGLSGS